jgi:phosphatidylethanolamine/phosphatidyl-N-methylethanolamine N-methyltransferase
MRMSNRWNLFVYRLWAPVYDATVGHLFMPGRRRAIQLLALQPGERVLLVGVGTGADLPLLPPGVQAMGTDLSPEMLDRARQKLTQCPASVELVQGDAQRLLVPEGSFDAAILNLILSVVPDGHACLDATLQALRPNGRAVVFDKFQADGTEPSVWRRCANWFSTAFGTDITRCFADLARGLDLTITLNEPSLLGGLYRVLLIRKRAAPAVVPRG